MGTVSYLQAPATALVATECACCGKPLLDAESVEAGVGPTCRERWGYGVAAGTTSWEAAAALLGPARERLGLAGAWGTDARAAANVLVRAIAARAVGTEGIAALIALGYVALGVKLAGRAGMPCIVVEDAGRGLLRVRTSWSPRFNEAIHEVRGSYWGRAEKARFVPASERAGLWAALKTAFPAGTVVRGTRGVSIL